MAYLQNNSAFIPNGLTRYLPHSNQCDETNRSLTKWFGDAESCAQCPIYYDQRPVRFADRTICGGVYRSVSLNDELPNLPPNSYGTLAKRKREKVYLNKACIPIWSKQSFLGQNTNGNVVSSRRQEYRILTIPLTHKERKTIRMHSRHLNRRTTRLQSK